MTGGAAWRPSHIKHTRDVTCPTQSLWSINSCWFNVRAHATSGNMSRNFVSVSKRKLVLLQTSASICYLKWYHQIFPVSFITPAGRSRRLCSLTRRLTTIESISSFCFFFLLLIQTGRRRYYAWAIQREFLFVFHTKWGFLCDVCRS